MSCWSTYCFSGLACAIKSAIIRDQCKKDQLSKPKCLKILLEGLIGATYHQPLLANRLKQADMVLGGPYQKVCHSIKKSSFVTTSSLCVMRVLLRWQKLGSLLSQSSEEVGTGSKCHMTSQSSACA